MSDNKIPRFDDELKKFLNKKINVKTTTETLSGILISWDFKHQSIIIEGNIRRIFIRGSSIESIDFICEPVSKNSPIIAIEE